MNIKSFILAIFAIVMMVLPAAAEAPQEVTLTVTSDGPTKEDATKNALRTAIEQAYGAFVSANTTILNDELVKDEIVTVSNGSIKDYKEITSAQTPNGSYNITLSATVSLPNLISYAKSHGSECEFAGNIFGMEMKLFKIQKENELKALYNSIPVIEAMIRNSIRWNMEVEEPRLASNEYADVISEIENGVYEGYNGKYYYYDGDEEYNIKSLNYLLYGDEKHPDSKERLNIELFKNIMPLSKGENVEVTFKIGCAYNYKGVKQYVQDLLGGLSLSYDEYWNYKRKGFNPGCFSYKGLYGFVKVPYKEDVHYLDYIGWWLRSSEEDIWRWYDILTMTVLQIKNDFKIIDNTEQESYFNPMYFSLLPKANINEENKGIIIIGDMRIEYYDTSEESWLKWLDFFNKNFCGETDTYYGGGGFKGSFKGLKGIGKSNYGDFLCTGGSGLFSKLFKISNDCFGTTYMIGKDSKYHSNGIRDIVDLYCDWEDPRSEPEETVLPWKITVILPASEIESYSSFRVITANTPKLDIPFKDI